MNIRLTDEILYVPTKKISETDSQKVFHTTLKIKEWLKTKAAYAVAANQLGFHDSFFVAHRKYKRWSLPTDIYFNPSFIPANDKQEKSGEKCLSYPGKEFQIMRFSSIVLSYFDPWESKSKQILLSGLPAIIAQHEITHLLGIDERSLDIQNKKIISED